MPVTIKYIGTSDNYAELPVTGKQSIWQIGQQEERPDNEASLLMATGLFYSPPVPVFASTNLTGGIEKLTANGVDLGLVIHAPAYGVPVNGIDDCYDSIMAIIDAIKSRDIEARTIIFPYNGNGGYKTSQQIKITTPLHLHFEDDLIGTFTTKQCTLLFEGQYSTTDESKLLRGAKVTGNGRCKIDGNGSNITGYTYDTADTYYSSLLFKWCHSPLAESVRLTNGLVNGGRAFQCKKPVFAFCEGDNSVWDNGLSIDFDAPTYLANDPTTWSYGGFWQCKGRDNRKGCGITTYASPMRAWMVGCYAWNNGATEAVTDGGVIGTGFSIEDDFNNKHVKTPKIRVFDCHAWDNANGFFVTSDYVYIDKSCSAENNSYPFHASDSANLHGCGYSFANTRHVSCFGSSRNNLKYGLHALGYQTLAITQAEFGGRHGGNYTSGILVQGAGDAVFVHDYDLNGNCAAGTTVSLAVKNIEDYNLGGGVVTIGDGVINGGGGSALKVSGIGNVKVSGVKGHGNCINIAAPAVFVEDCTTATVDSVSMTGSTQTHSVQVNAGTQAASVNGVSGGGTIAVVDNSSVTPFGVCGDLVTVVDADFTARLGNVQSILYAASITAARTVSLPAIASKGDCVITTRKGAGAGTLSVGGLKSLTQNQWCRVEYSGSAWVLMASGTV